MVFDMFWQEWLSQTNSINDEHFALNVPGNLSSEHMCLVPIVTISCNGVKMSAKEKVYHIFMLKNL